MEPTRTGQTGLTEDSEEPMEGPSKVTSVLMVIVGVLFLVPFVFVSITGNFFSALFTFGWTLALGTVFLLFGLRRLRWTPEDDQD